MLAWLRRLGTLRLLSAALAALLAGPLEAQDPPEEEWRTLEGPRLVVYHIAGYEGLAESVLRFLSQQPPLPALPPHLPTGVSAYLAPNAGAFARLTGGRVPEWSAGVAIPALGRLVLPVYASSWTLGGDRGRVLRHEWAHLGLAQHVEGLRVPRWFDEGYAEWAAGWDRSQAWQLRLLLASGRAPPLDSLTLVWPRDAASARAAYMLSATAVEYLVSESGERGLELFLDRWKEEGAFEEGLRATYGVTTEQFEGHWRTYVKRHYGWLLVLSHSMVFWSALALLLLLLLGVRRRRDREHLARLRAGEEEEPPVWWGEGDGESPPSGRPPW